MPGSVASGTLFIIGTVNKTLITIRVRTVRKRDMRLPVYLKPNIVY